MTDLEIRKDNEDSTAAKAEDVAMIAAPIVEAKVMPPAKESGYARAARLRAAGSQTVTAVTPLRSLNDAEPYEDTGFGD